MARESMRYDVYRDEMIGSCSWGESAMESSESHQRCRTIYLYAGSLVSSLLCFAFLWVHQCARMERTADPYSLALLFGGIGSLLFPCLSRLKLGGLIEMEQRLAEGVRRVEAIALRGAAVRDESGTLSYIGKVGERHLLPDEETARFLADFKGIVPVSRKDVEPYPLTDPSMMESVLACPILHFDPHYWAVLNGRRYHVGSVDDLIDWGRNHPEDWTKVESEADVTQYPRGR
jgi:hypothetical protein